MNATRSCLFVLPLLAASAWLLAEEKPRPRPLDRTKRLMIERPAAEVLAGTSAVIGENATAPPNGSGTIVTPDVAARLMVAAQVSRLADRGKGSVEIPLKEFIAGQSVLGRTSAITNAPAAAPPAETEETAETFVNPKVEPGKVRWHADFAAACAAAEQSGKPVLLFQMMGKLDDRFC